MLLMNFKKDEGDVATKNAEMRLLIMKICLPYIEIRHATL